MRRAVPARRRRPWFRRGNALVEVRNDEVLAGALDAQILAAMPAHAESAESKSHAESAEVAELASHAEGAENAEEKAQ